MWRLIYVLLIGVVVLTWETVRVSLGDATPAQGPVAAAVTPTAGAASPAHPVKLDSPLWPTAPLSEMAQPVTISIPRISVNAPVLDRGLNAQGLLTIAPGYTVTHFQDSAAPGAAGNYVAYGHDDIQGQVFKSLSLLSTGDTVTLAQGAHRYVYLITGSHVVLPTAIEVLRPTATPSLTLISCTPYEVDTHRIVVTAILVQVS